VKPLAQNHTIIRRSPNPETVYCYSPGIVRLDTGRLIATMDLGGPGVGHLPGQPEERKKLSTDWLMCIYTSDDSGKSWTQRASFPIRHSRPFVAGNRIYVLGHDGDLFITASDDNGETWSSITKLTQDEVWHQAPCNVWYAHNNVYLVMERRQQHRVTSWPVSELAPILMRASISSDLREPNSWTYSDSPAYSEAINDRTFDGFGLPFFPGFYPQHFRGSNRTAAPSGWLETNVVQILDPEHYWHDPSGCTYHLLMRANTHGSGYAMLAKIIEESPGSGPMRFEFETAPSGTRQFYLPFPGGQMKFHLIYDEQTQLYWLLSTQATDSMRRIENLPEGRYNLPNNERRRLVLHFSKNLVDWCFAGLVAMGETEICSRHYASMTFDDQDLVVLSRSADQDTKSAHDTNMITFHRVQNFRSLVY